ncbi:MAG: response regulator, partial [Acidimicrobiales bacterium]
MPEASVTSVQRRVHVLLIEDDPGDAFLVRELLAADQTGDPAHGGFEVVWASTVAEAKQVAVHGIDCALIDLGLPDASGLEALHQVLAAWPDAAVVVLTGLADRELALQAVAAGAQDYLIKDEVKAGLLDRTLRLALERRRVERAAVALAESNLRQQHNRQVAQGLLPRLRVQDGRLVLATSYVQGSLVEVLGGDFLDAVELSDGTVRAIIGDVSGHGPDEAALGVSLRIA